LVGGGGGETPVDSSGVLPADGLTDAVRFLDVFGIVTHGRHIDSGSILVQL